MSQENVEVMREAFRRWNRRDIDYWIEHADSEVEVWSKYAALDEGGEPYRGHAGMREWRAEIDRNFEFHEVRADDFRSVGDQVVALGSVRFRGNASGSELQYPFGWVCEMRDGRLSRMTFHSSHAEALEAAGLEE
ncbi:MAG TPA: nuclear transport factor 2 family protein [Solirubrobacterales bacterium]|nr:nuclear transport factor 2 family protein [Solirubrobacterales bacterium]